MLRTRKLIMRRVRERPVSWTTTGGKSAGYSRWEEIVRDRPVEYEDLCDL